MPDDLDDVLQISFDALPLDAESDDASSPDDRFQVVDVEGEERISGLFEYDVVFEEPIVGAEGGVRSAPALPIDALTGTDVMLSFHRGDHTVRHVNGIVARLVHEHTSGAVAGVDRQRYRVRIRPELWLLTLTNDYRSFENVTVPNLVATILDEYQISYDEDSLDENLKDRYRPRKHVVQSGQSTFDFVDGLLEEAGIFYFFRQEPGLHTLVFGDDNMAFPAAPGGENEPPALRMGTRDQNDEHTLWSGALEENVVPDGHRVSDTHFDGATTVQQRERGEASVERKGRPLDVVEYPGGADRSTDDTPREHGPDILRRRLQQHRASKRLLRGVAPVRGLGSGEVFGLNGHDHGPINDTEFVARRLFVQASPSDGYQVEYEAFPASTRFRGYRYADLDGPRERAHGSPPSANGTEGAVAPQLQNTPVFEGRDLSLHLATVVDASGAEKKKGKVKVKFDWAFGEEEVWARLLQFSAGPPGDQSWGSQFVPREDAKVIVAQEQWARESSNMDPIVLGVLYQGEDKLPYPNGGNTERRSAIRTHSARGDDEDAVHNEIRFVDDANAEEIATFAPHKLVEAVGFEEDLQGAPLDVTVYKLKPEYKPSDYVPEASPVLSEGKYETLPPSEEESKYWLRQEAASTTNLPSEQYGDEIKHSEYKNMPKKSSFSLKEKYKNKLKNYEEEIDGFGNYVKLRGGDPVYKIKKYSRLKNLRDNGSIDSMYGDIDRRISVEAYNFMDDVTTYSGSLKGYEDMLRDAGRIKVYNVTLGKDAYKIPGPTRKCYKIEEKNVGKDVYYGPSPHQIIYEESRGNPFESADAGANRIEYTAGDPEKDGVLEACNGSYRIHAHGPRMEIYRTSAEDYTEDGDSPQDFFSQEMSAEWSIDGPDKLDSFEDNDPIVILNEDGAISIKSSEGINIESKKDINIQSKNSVNIRAGNNIECYAEDEMTHYGDDILIGGKRGRNEKSSIVKKVAREIISEAEIRHLVKGALLQMEASVKGRADMVSNTQKCIASSQRFIWNDQTMINHNDILLSASLVGLSLGEKLIKLENDLIDIETKPLKSVSGVAESQSDAAEIGSCISEITSLVLKNPKTAAHIATSAFKKSK